MAQVGSVELLNRFEGFYRTYCRDNIADLAQKYPADRKSLTVDWSE